ncbi:hypothetical protein N7533_003235 [Penicillium manginii]|jgi:hypothetical protein|uniref:uncharacterized protein n=1 Tax=Penicillium manginii TaxID=203109 RepID=UPI002547E095|nr:uncharacterized protein N7533_003235 [Penicillium manginii]KAJ5764554.1 hypothetical protein N7533_003235 [Penicillium manginii]
MSSAVTKPLAIFRKPENPKPLHTRWGDVAISVPTDGSWNQYDNPHRPAKGRQLYGPGFIPDISPSDQTRNSLKDDNTEDQREEVAPEKSSVSRRSSLSLGALRPGRLSVRLASRPKPLEGESASEREIRDDQKRRDFAYKPIRKDYTAEVIDQPGHTSNRFRYIPTNGTYLEDIPSPRSQSAQSFYSPHERPDSFSDPFEGRDRGRKSSLSKEPSEKWPAYQEDDRLSLRSSIGGSSDGSGSRLSSSFGLPPRRRTSPFVAADRKRSSSLKPMTMAMVPDPEDLYE